MWSRPHGSGNPPKPGLSLLLAIPDGWCPKWATQLWPVDWVDEVINGAGPLYIDRVYGFDLWGFNNLAALAVPVIWHRKDKVWSGLAKVILIMMPCEQASMLEPQLRRLKPTVIPERFQFI